MHELMGYLVVIGMVLLGIGWVVPLVMGIVRLRKQTGGGAALIIVGAVWGLLSICVGALLAFGIYSIFRNF